MRNSIDETYTPYKDGKGQWWFDDKYRTAQGPFIWEESAVNAAARKQEEDEK